MNDRKFSRSIRIGMPQMALGCLSENWLLKELGDLHWERLCDSLRSKSNEITDSSGRRLYATFVRVRISLEDTLAAFGEGDELRLAIQTARFGRSSVLSTISIDSETSAGTAMLLSTFSFRSADDNTSLARSEPQREFDPSIKALTDPPEFFSEYSIVRKRYGQSRRADFPSQNGCVYRINPFTDSNGANLLYFASYQAVHDFLSSRCVKYHTKFRDIYYFRNSDLSDSIERVAVDEHADLLFRKSDGASMAFVVTTKKPA